MPIWLQRGETSSFVAYRAEVVWLYRVRGETWLQSFFNFPLVCLKTHQRMDRTSRVWEMVISNIYSSVRSCSRPTEELWMQVRTELGSLLKVAMVEDSVTTLTALNSKPFPSSIVQKIYPSCCSSQADVLVETNIVDVIVPSCKLCKQVSCPLTSAGRSRASSKGLGPEPGSRYLGMYQSCSGGRVRSLDLDPKAGNFCRYKTSQFQ